MKRRLNDYYFRTRPNGLLWPHATLITLQNHKLLYCPIAKNSCTSLKRLMVSLSDVEHKKLLLAADVHRGVDRHRTGLKLQDHDLDFARQIMDSEEYFKFAVVRDPFTRLVSAYIEKFVVARFAEPNQRHTAPVIAAVQGSDRPDYRRGITFAEFIRYLTDQAPKNLDPHWKPQVLYLEGIRYSRIYPMDRLDTLCRDLAARVGRSVVLEKRNVIEKPRSKLLPDAAHQYANELKKPRRIDKRSFLDSELMFRIATYFAEDYHLYLRGRQDVDPATASPHASTSVSKLGMTQK